MADLFKPYPKTIFKFYANNALNIKSLMYGELFFAANDELNDPYDTKLSYLFKKDKKKILRLIRNFICVDNQVSNVLFPLIDIINWGKIANELAQSDLSINEILAKISSKDFETIVLNVFADANLLESIGLASVFIKHLKKHIQIRLGHLAYIVSFSKQNNDPVMWSHYANHHHGFCLCFSIDDGTLQSTSNYQSYVLKKEYTIAEVNYEEQTIHANAYFGFHESIIGRTVLENEVLEFHRRIKQSYLTKYKSWRYEKEVRLLDFDFFRSNVRNGEILKNTANERIFYYDQKQLTGIILGSRMSAREKEELKSIIYNLRQKLVLGNTILPNFIF